MNNPEKIQDLEKRRRFFKKGTVRDKIRSKTILIPSLITMCGIFCGFLAIVSAFNGKFAYAAKCVLLAIILDGLDGRAARRLNAVTAFGKEFDSLSDLVAFGVAPGILVYSWALSQVADEIGLLASFLYVVCCATRLARFNIDTEGGLKSFTGLPSPGAAAAMVTLIYCFPEPINSIWLATAAMAYTICIAFLMVSNLSFLSIKTIQWKEANKPQSMLLIAAMIVLLWKYNQEMLFLVATLYAWSGPAKYLLKKAKKA